MTFTHRTFIRWRTKRQLVNRPPSHRIIPARRFPIRFTTRLPPTTTTTTIIQLQVQIRTRHQMLATRRRKMSIKAARWTETRVPTRLISSRATTTTTTFSCRRHRTVSWRPSWAQHQATATATMALMPSMSRLRRKTRRSSRTTTTTARGALQAPATINFRCRTHRRSIPVPTTQRTIHQLRSTALTTISRRLWFRIRTSQALLIHTAERASACRSLSTRGISEWTLWM